MKVLLLNSPWINTPAQYGLKSGTRWGALRNKDRFMPYYPYPYFLANAASIIKEAGFEMFIKDAVAEELTKEQCLDYVEQVNPDLILSEVFTPSIYVDIDFLKNVKQRVKSVIACAGIHASGLPEEMLAQDFIDFVVMWEMDYTLRELAEFIKAGRTDFENIKGLAFKKEKDIIVTPRRDVIKNLDELPFPETDQLPMERYSEPFSKKRKTAKITVSRGCPYKCSFCVEAANYNRSYKHRSLPLVISEIRRLQEKYGIEEIYFDDPIVMPDWGKKLAEALIENKVKVNWHCWIHWGTPYETLKLMKHSGCIGVKFGIESIDQEVRKGANKPEPVKDIEVLIANCRKLGLMTLGAFCIGLQKDTPETMKRTIDFAAESGLTTFQVSMATPLPGTAFFDEAKKNNWLTTMDWSRYEPNTSYVLSYPQLKDNDVYKAMTYAQYRKAKMFISHPTLALQYIFKLWKYKGTAGFIKEVIQKTAFVRQSLLSQKN